MASSLSMSGGFDLQLLQRDMPVLGLFLGACGTKADRTLGEVGDLPGVNGLAVQEDLDLVAALDGLVVRLTEHKKMVQHRVFRALNPCLRQRI
jgi:hypothetical protein